MMKIFIKNFTIISILIGSIILSSCEKKSIDPKNLENTTSDDILSFNSIEEYQAEMNTIISLSFDELKEYEESKGFRSFGSISEELYRNINFDNFSSKEEILEFVEQNNTHLQLIEDENGELELETKFYNSAQRYFLNKDHMFEIGNTSYKVIDQGIVSCQSKNIEMLKQINDDNILAFAEDNETISFVSNTPNTTTNGLKDATYNCGTSKTARATSNRDRTKIDMSIDFLHTYAYVYQNGQEISVPQSILNNRILIRPYKKTLGIWYWCSRTISCNIKVAVDKYIDSNWVRDKYSIAKTKSDSKLEFILEGGVISMGYHTTIPMHYGGIDSWADTPSTSPAKIQCNTSIAQ